MICGVPKLSVVETQSHASRMRTLECTRSAVVVVRVDAEVQARPPHHLAGRFLEFARGRAN